MRVSQVKIVDIHLEYEDVWDCLSKRSFLIDR